MFPTDVVIVAGARTPMARYTGAFSEVSAIELAAHASREAIRRSGVDPSEFDHAIFGNVRQKSADGIEARRGSAGRFVDGGIDGHVLWIADGADGGKTRGTARNHSEGCRRVRAAQPAGSGGGLQRLPNQGRTGCSGSEAGKENDFGQRRRSQAAGNDDGHAGEIAAIV